MELHTESIHFINHHSKLYSFIKRFYESNCISDNVKHEVTNDFIKQYLLINNFRIYCKGQYLMFSKRDKNFIYNKYDGLKFRNEIQEFENLNPKVDYLIIEIKDNFDIDIEVKDNLNTEIKNKLTLYKKFKNLFNI